MKKFLFIFTLLLAVITVEARAQTPIRVMKTNVMGVQPEEAEIVKTIRAHIDVAKFREVKTQLIRDEQGKPSYYLVYLHSKTSHRVDIDKINIDKNFKVLSVEHNYKLKPIDFKQQPGISLSHATCPDNSIEFIAFAPNDIQLEQDVTIDVATAAEARLKTVRLLRDQATRDNYLKYLTCPLLRGNFYDGDANPQLFTTVDGVISADDINTILSKKFQFRVTNIWLACQAYNDPMLSAVIDGAQTRKYAAGINDLAVGPSDYAGACAMKAAIAGQPMKASFDNCYQTLDILSDHWGFGGNGIDYFWDETYPVTIWGYTGTPCSGNSCPGWQRLDNNSKTVAIAASGGNLYQMHNDGMIWKSTGVPCSGNSCPGWQLLDNNPKGIAVIADGGNLYQLHNDGMMWRYTGTPCSGNSCPGWQLLDNNSRTTQIAAGGGSLYQMHSDILYQLHNSGLIWSYVGTPCSGNSCPGWQLLDNNPQTAAITSAGRQLFQLHQNGKIWRYTGKPCSGNSCPGWQLLDNNTQTAAITAADQLFQLHHDGKIWRYTGAPCSGTSCPGWQLLDNNPQTVSIKAAGRELFQLHQNGKIWRYTGKPCSGNSCPGWQLLDNNTQTAAITAADQLFQLHHDGKIWRYTGTPCSGNSCPGWQLLDNNTHTVAISASGRQLFQLHGDNGTIWRYMGKPCSGASCPGWQLLDNNSQTSAIAIGKQLFQLHSDGKIWRYTGQPCAGASCSGWEMLDNNPATRALTGSYMQ